ncbi:hypothetical protein [Pontibacter roseus]|uniref:hypothetical protein n=1 Tax=Pontibacter roseus TaxID=336989 RepID=UPI000373FD4D|nr:hypothetical protein [Pontibacter roseus]
MSKKFVLVMFVLSIIVAALYAYLGGFSSATVSEVNSQQLYVAGRAFNGSVKDEQLNSVFRRAAEVLDKKELEGVLGNIYYNNPDESSDSINAFIGVIIPDTAAQLPADYELRSVPGNRRALRSEVDAHYMLAPNKLYEAVFDYAEEQKLALETFYVEWFPEERKGVVEVPIKE